MMDGVAVANIFACFVGRLAGSDDFVGLMILLARYFAREMLLNWRYDMNCMIRL